MVARPWEHADEARAALRAILEDPGLGIAVLSSGRLVANVLEDMLPDAPRERAVLVMAAQASLATALQDYVQQGIDPVTAVSLAAVLLENSSPLDPDTCRWIATELAGALGIDGIQPAPGVPAVTITPPEAPTAEPRSEPPTRTARALPDRALPARALADGALADGALADGALADGALADRALPDRALPDRALPDRALPDRALADRALADRALADRALPDRSPGGSPPAAAPPSPQDRPRRRKHRQQRANSAVFSPDGRLIATAESDGAARLWDVGTGRLVHGLATLSGEARSVAFSPDGQFIATAAAGDVARLWDATTTALVRQITRAHAKDVAFSPDGQLLATAGGSSSQPAGIAAPVATDNSALLWDTATGNLVRRMSGAVFDDVKAVLFSPDGRLLATAHGTSVWLWDVATGSQVRRLPARGPAISFSPDGRMLATAGGGELARLWDIATATLIRAVTVSPARDVAFSPDGEMVATAGGGLPAAGITAATIPDNAGWLWTVANGNLIRKLTGHQDQVQTVAFSPDSHLLVSTGRDKTTRLWDLRSAHPDHRRIGGEDQAR